MVSTDFQDLGIEEASDEVVPLPNVTAPILKKVTEWATYHKDDPPPSPEEDDKQRRTDDIIEWDKDFFKVDINNLHPLWCITATL